MRLLLGPRVRAAILVSDGTSATGCQTNLSPGNLRCDGFRRCVPRAEGKLAGSTLTLDRALRNIVALDVKLADALAMLTANPARLLGLEGRKGALVPGADADLVLLDAELQVKSVITRGAGTDGN